MTRHTREAVNSNHGLGVLGGRTNLQRADSCILHFWGQRTQVGSKLVGRACACTRRAPPHQVWSVNEGVRHSDAVCRPQQSVDLHANRQTARNIWGALASRTVCGAHCHLPQHSFRAAQVQAACCSHMLLLPCRHQHAPHVLLLQLCTRSHTHTDMQSALCGTAMHDTPAHTPCS